MLKYTTMPSRTIIIRMPMAVIKASLVATNAAAEEITTLATRNTTYITRMTGTASLKACHLWPFISRRLRKRAWNALGAVPSSSRYRLSRKP